jgi:hypothetical protein
VNIGRASFMDEQSPPNFDEREIERTRKLLAAVRKDMKVFRGESRTPAAYTVEQHRAIEHMFALTGFIIDELRKRVSCLEKNRMKYCGVWDHKATYPCGSLVTHAGSLWHANIEMTGYRPGSGNGWVLAVKRGKDAR